MNSDLSGWCVIVVRAHHAYPTMTSNIADLDGARYQAEHVKAGGGRILALCKEADLEKLVPLLTLCRELDVEMDGVKCPKSAAAILNRIRSLIE